MYLVEQDGQLIAQVDNSDSVGQPFNKSNKFYFSLEITKKLKAHPEYLERDFWQMTVCQIDHENIRWQIHKHVPADLVVHTPDTYEGVVKMEGDTPILS